MTSNMFAGEKRRSSTRRSAMIVLGKVPKPLNLPSQRLENHGLDPNAEIVPKGTINWGNRPTGNAWNSALSPKSDGGSGFSSDIGARPSSGGSGTRPSTAASDKGHEPVPSSWGSNSRPSSASGALSSNQSTLTSLRPHSAETRPGSSSQLSRFAENLTDNSVALVPPGISEKLGGSSSTNDGFNLSSGDFPTLGSQKDNSGKNTDYRDNGSTSRPSSASGMAASVNEKKTDVSVGDVINVNVRTGNVDTWRRADSEHFDDGGTKHSMNKWQGGETYAYPNATMPPQLVDAWSGHQINASSHGVWYRGPPGGPPYRPPLGPGSFSLDPFTYYGPQIQNPGLANPRPIPPPNSRPRGHHPGNPDLYRPHIPDAYMRPMPITPGFYHRPMPFEGYYRPSMGFGSAKEHDISFTSMPLPPGPPPVYNMYSGEHSSDPGKDHTRASADGCAGNSLGSEHVESVYQHDNQGQCRVLLKQHHETVGKQENSDWKQTVSIVDKSGSERIIEKNEGGNGGTNELGRTHKQDTSSWSVGNQKQDSDMSKSNILFGTSNMNNVNFGLATKSKHSASSTSQVSHVSTTPKPILIQKIEGLNAKTRDSGTSIRGKFHANDRNRGGGDLIQSEKVGAPLQDINPKPTTFTEAAIPRVPGHEMQGKLDHHGRRFNAQGGDGWQKKSHNVESSQVISVGNAKLGTSYLQDQQFSEDAVEKPRTNLRVNKVEGEASCAEFDKSNGEAQRAKMREMARDRAKQLQKEEEERKREQKAKALLKLEELNKRTFPADGLVQKGETPSAPARVNDQEKKESPVVVESGTVAAKIEISTLNLISDKGVTESNTQITDSAEYKVPAQSSEGSMSRHKPMGHNKQRQNSARGKISTEKSSGSTHVKLEVPGNFNQVIANGFASEGVVVDESFRSGDLNLLNSLKNVDDPPACYKKKNNRSGKMKPKVDDDTTVKNPFHISAPSDSMEQSVGWEMSSDPNSTQVQNDMITIEEGNPKPQRSQIFPKNQHTNRNLENFRGSDGAIWAPVRLVQTKTEVSEEASGKISDEIPAGKSDTEGLNNQKSKRAEIKRYVPKPVAMGHTQQQVSSSDDQAVQNEVVVERDEPDSQKMVGSTDPPQYKQKKIHGSWRQRESTTNARSSYNVSKSEPMCFEDTRSFSEHSDSTSAVVTQPIKEERVDGQRRYASKSHRNMASNSSHNNMNYDNSGGHPSGDSSQKEKGNNNGLKENRGGERNVASSHWQPKYQSSSQNQQNRSSGGKNAEAAAASASTEENEVLVGWSGNNEERVEQKVKPLPSKSQDDVKKELKTAAGGGGAKRGGGRPSSPNQNPKDMLVESFPVDTRSYVRQQQPPPSLGGSYKNGNQNSRYGGRGGGGGGYESHNHNHHQYGNSDNKQRQNNSRFEYKPVGPQAPNTSSTKLNNNRFEESSAESSSSRSNTNTGGMLPKYKEKNPHLH